MITPLEMRVLDANARHYGVSILDAMERAGKGVADHILGAMGGAGKRVALLVGTGNNGGDGLVAARYLRERCYVTLVLARPPNHFSTEETRRNWGLVEGGNPAVGPEGAARALAEAELLVDALLGIGSEGPVREPYRSLIAQTNATGKPVVSVDVPSGFGSDLQVRPAATVTMHAVKEGMTPAACGEIVVVDIGFTEELARLCGPGDLLHYPVPGTASHKGDNGRLLVIGGGPFTGAPALVGFGAYGIGVDVVHIATPSAVWEVVAGYSPSLIVHPLDGAHLTGKHVPEVATLLEGADAVVLGPGLGTHEDTLVGVRDIVAECDRPMVLDADALTALAGHLELLEGKSAVLTPHAGEFRVLTEQALPPDPDGRAEHVRALAESTGAVVLLKGPTDVLSDGAAVKFNTTGNPGMTVGGTGDVLAGILGGLLAKGAPPWPAARMAAFASGDAGDRAYRARSYGLLPTDVAATLPEVLKSFVAQL